jgi:hypothetical protein
MSQEGVKTAVSVLARRKGVKTAVSVLARRTKKTALHLGEVPVNNCTVQREELLVALFVLVTLH